MSGSFPLPDTYFQLVPERALFMAFIASVQLPSTTSVVSPGVWLIITDAFGLVVLPVAGGNDRGTGCIIKVSTRYAACGSIRAADSFRSMVAGGQGARKIVTRYTAYIDRAGSSACAGHAARGIAGDEGARKITSHHATGIGVVCGGSFSCHIARGIAGGQRGTISFTLPRRRLRSFHPLWPRKCIR